jgi:hypothetical protein
VLELIPFTLLVLYLIPFLVASARGFDMPVAFLLMNFAIGWTVLGWFLLLFVALAGSGNATSSERRS